MSFFWHGGKRQELITTDEAIVIHVARFKPLSHLGGFSSDAELGQRELGILVRAPRIRPEQQITLSCVLIIEFDEMNGVIIVDVAKNGVGIASGYFTVGL